MVAVALIGRCLAGSYALGERTSWGLTPSLEQQTSFYVDEALRRFQPNNPNAGISTQEEVASSRYVWGRTDVSLGPLEFLWTLRQGMPEASKTSRRRRTETDPAWCLGSCRQGLALRWRWGARRRLAGARIPREPGAFAVALQGTANMVGHSRYMANGITMVPVLLGLGFAVCAQGALQHQDEARGGRSCADRSGSVWGSSCVWCWEWYPPGSRQSPTGRHP